MTVLAGPGAGTGWARPAGPTDAPVPAPPEGAPELPAPPTVVGVEISVGGGADTAELQPLVAVRTGAPLSSREVRRTLERLYATGRFADLSVDELPAGSGKVALLITAVPRTWIDRFVFDGNAVLTTEALRRATNAPERRLEFYPEFVTRVVERLQAAYQRVGYANTNIGTELTRDGRGGLGVLTFHIDEGAPTRLRSISLAGDPQLPLEDVLETLGLRPGDVLNLEQLDAGVRALRVRFREEQHYQARVGVPEVVTDETGAHVRLPISAGPRFTFRFNGNRAFDDAQLLRVLGYQGDEPLDEALRAQLETRVADWYRLAGYADVQVRAREVRARNGEGVVVLFGVNEGDVLGVVDVRFEGNRHFSQKFLRARLDEALLEAVPEEVPESANGDDTVVTGVQPVRARARVRPEATSVLYEPAYRLAIGRILDLYRADGYLGAFISLPDVRRDERTRQARVTISIREGVQTLLQEVEFDGGNDPRGYAKAAALRKGRPYNALDVENARLELLRYLRQHGYAFAGVQDEERLTEDHTAATVVFHIVQGPQVRVGRVLVEGNDRTAEGTVRAALAVREKGVLDPDALVQSQRNLVRLGIFRTASVRMSSPELPEETKDVYVEVEERSTIQVTVGGGYSLIDGPRAFAEFTKTNLFGRALQLQLRAKVNYLNLSLPVLDNPTYYQQSGLDALGRRLNLSLQYPRILALLPTELGARIDLVHERLNRFSYLFQRTAAIVGTDLVAGGGLTTSLQYEIETDLLEKGPNDPHVHPSRSDLERLRFNQGRIDMHSIRPSIGWDRRDDPANPHRGFLLSTTLEVVQSLGGLTKDDNGKESVPFALFVKGTAQANLYVPVWYRTVLALSVRGGKIFPLRENSVTPPPKRFFLGGPSSLRGFLEDSMQPEDSRQDLRDQRRQCSGALSRTGCTTDAQKLANGETLLSEGGQLFALARAELRFPLLWKLEGALFLDAGNLWSNPDAALKSFRLRTATGFGVRLVTPIGPAALDLGINLAPDKLLNESTFVPNFSIGLF